MKKFLITTAFCLIAGVAIAQTPRSFDEPGNYMSLAAGFEHLNGGSRVSVGVGTGHTAREADANAIDQCQSGQFRGSCTIRGRAWNGGCGYIVTGRGDNGTTQYGAGSTPEAAIENVQQAGATEWHKPIGGCTNRPE